MLRDRRSLLWVGFFLGRWCYRLSRVVPDLHVWKGECHLAQRSAVTARRCSDRDPSLRKCSCVRLPTFRKISGLPRRTSSDKIYGILILLSWCVSQVGRCPRIGLNRSKLPMRMGNKFVRNYARWGCGSLSWPTISKPFGGYFFWPVLVSWMAESNWGSGSYAGVRETVDGLGGKGLCYGEGAR